MILDTLSTTTIRAMRAEDGPAVLHIYQQGADTGHATFQTAAPSWDEWDRAHMRDARLIAERNAAIAGWAALARVSSRPDYAGVAELSIYIADDARGVGVGRLLLESLIESAEAAGYWMLEAGVFPENSASIALHKSMGFRIVGTRERLGRMTHGPMTGVWRDVVFLERRSPTIGVE
jgi:phosphinothricin acetyltransferase